MNINSNTDNNQRSYIYKITSPNGRDSFHIYLAKHILPKHMFELPKKIDQIIEISDKVFIECNPSSDVAYLNNEALRKLSKYSNEKNDKIHSYHNSVIQKQQEGDIMVLDEPTVDLDLECMVKSMVDMKKKFVGSKDHLLVGINHLAFSLLYKGEVIFTENEILKLCNKHNVEVSHLDEEFEIIEDYHKLYINDLVENTLTILNRLSTKENFDFHKEIEDEMNIQYKELDFSGTEKRMKNQKNFYSSVTERNHSWIPKMIDNPNSLFVIGADHWPGEEGVNALLQNKGYSIEPINV